MEIICERAQWPSKPSLIRKKKGAKWVRSLLETLGLEVTTEGVRIGAHSENWRETHNLTHANV